jgi:hypothetical protein
MFTYHIYKVVQKYEFEVKEDTKENRERAIDLVKDERLSPKFCDASLVLVSTEDTKYESRIESQAHV